MYVHANDENFIYDQIYKSFLQTRSESARMLNTTCSNDFYDLVFIPRNKSIFINEQIQITTLNKFLEWTVFNYW